MHMQGRIVCADVLTALRDMPDNSFDGVFCDPPYELGFMGKSWDSTGIAFQPETWAEVLRVCKPGAHLLAFGGSRTFHRLVCAVEDAGWEVRDVLMYLYGSGFPKSLDVSKAIDKARTEDAEPVRVVCRFLRAQMEERGLNSKDLAPLFDCHPRLVDHWAARDSDSQPSLPTWEQWQTLREHMKLPDDMDAEVWRLNGRKGQHGDAWKNAEVTGEYMGTPGGLGGERFTFLEQAIKAPATDAARQWDGYGTALKPAYEPVVLARKPLDGTVAQNVQKWGCGALWIDGGRIEGVVPQVTQGGQRSSGGIMNATGGERGTVSQPHELGRWPANALHDGLPEEWSRYFYCAKASTRERNAGCEALPERSAGDVTGGRKDGSAGLNSPRAGAGRISGARNFHPTVKPLDLCRYLATLILPPADRPQGPRHLLVPFSGSGSEMIGSLLAGWDDVTGIEREAEYVEIAKARLKLWTAPKMERASTQQLSMLAHLGVP